MHTVSKFMPRVFEASTAVLRRYISPFQNDGERWNHGRIDGTYGLSKLFIGQTSLGFAFGSFHTSYSWKGLVYSAL